MKQVSGQGTRRALPWPLVALTPILLVGCKGELSTLQAEGPAAEMIAWLWWGMLAGAAGLTALVLGLIFWGFRPPSARAPGERFWAMGMGIVFSLVILTLAVGSGLWVGEKLQARPSAEVVRVKAEARQWAWRFTQTHPEDGEVVTDNLLYIPAGVPVDVEITTLDVVHSFWVPRLAGKLDAIPGHTNILRLEARTPGRYRGISAEFSGEGYGDMRFEVVAYPESDPPPFLQPEAPR